MISAFHPGRTTRLIMYEATNESISLNPSKVRMAIFMPDPVTHPGRERPVHFRVGGSRTWCVKTDFR